MPDLTQASGRTAIVFAPTGDPDVPSLLQALQHAQIDAVVANQASQGLGLICRRPAKALPPSVVIILGGLPGMAAAAIAKAVRGLPGMASVPLIVVGESPLGLTRCDMVAHAADTTTICRLAAAEPAAWLTPGTDPSTPASVSFPAFPAPPTSSRGVVLVVDDTATNLMVMSLQARSSGHPIETCVDGKAAVARVAAGGVALVLMDCQMPEMDGYDATREIRRLEVEAGQGKRMPIIAVTAHAMEENRIRCLEAGMDDFLPKPIHQDTLLARIHHWLPTLSPAKPAATALPAAADVIFDPGPLLRIEQDAPGASREILAIISKDLQQAQADLPRLLAAENLDALAKTGHRLKGASGSVGATACAHACAGLEHAAKAGDLAGSCQAAEAITTAINRLTERIQSILNASPKE